MGYELFTAVKISEMGATGSSETSVNTYKTTWLHNVDFSLIQILKLFIELQVSYINKSEIKVRCLRILLSFTFFPCLRRSSVLCFLCLSSFYFLFSSIASFFLHALLISFFVYFLLLTLFLLFMLFLTFLISSFLVLLFIVLFFLFPFLLSFFVCFFISSLCQSNSRACLNSMGRLMYNHHEPPMFNQIHAQRSLKNTLNKLHDQ
jgi:ABC-type transport system involved in multi-copper enzyme maturation permease subunit